MPVGAVFVLGVHIFPNENLVKLISGDGEFRTGEPLPLRVHLDELEAGNVGADLRIRGFSHWLSGLIRILLVANERFIGIIGVLELYIVRISLHADDSIFVDGRGISNGDGSAFLILIAYEILEDDLNFGAAGCLLGSNGEVSARCKCLIPNRDSHILVEGQSRGHGVLQNKEILGVAGHIGNLGGDFVINHIADGSVVGLHSVLVLDDLFIHNGQFGLDIDLHIGIGGGQHQGGDGGGLSGVLHHIVAQGQIG